jgi:hydrogenase/urease accessory protein HupE
VYALFGVVLIPVSFLAVRIAGTILHPTIFTHEGANLPNSMLFAFIVCLGGMLALAATLYRVELTGKRADESLRELRELLT